MVVVRAVLSTIGCFRAPTTNYSQTSVGRFWGWPFLSLEGVPPSLRTATVSGSFPHMEGAGRRNAFPPGGPERAGAGSPRESVWVTPSRSKAWDVSVKGAMTELWTALLV